MNSSQKYNCIFYSKTVVLYKYDCTPTKCLFIYLNNLVKYHALQQSTSICNHFVDNLLTLFFLADLSHRIKWTMKK